MNAFDAITMGGEDAQRELSFEMALRGPQGALAACLFQLQIVHETSIHNRSKSYLNPSYRRKVEILGRIGHWFEINRYDYGWQRKTRTNWYDWVFYGNLPTGQCVYDSTRRGDGPQFRGDIRVYNDSRLNVLDFCDAVLKQQPTYALVMPFSAFTGVKLLELSGEFKLWLRTNYPTYFFQFFPNF